MFPQWLEGADASNPSLVGLHPYDTQRNGFIRYIVTTVYSFTNSTKVVGYILVGDQITGKMGIPGNVYITMWGSTSPRVSDGFVGIYMSDEETRDGWNVCSHAAMATIPGMNSRALSLDVDPAPRKLLDKALASGVVENTSNKKDAFIYVAKKAPNLSATVPGDQLDPPIVLVQATHSEYWRRAFERSMGMLAVVFAIDIFAIWMASCIFLEPLERLGSRIRKGKQLNMKTVERLKHRRHLIIPILCIPLLSLGYSIYSVDWAVNYIHDTRIDASLKETSSLGASYIQKTDVMRIGYSALAQQSNFKIVAANTNVTSAALANVKLQLKNTQTAKMLQFSLIVDINKQVLYDPNGDQFTGQKFDPHGIVSAGLTNSDPYVTSVILTNAEYTKLNPPTFSASLYTTTPPSKLSPRDAPQNDVLVRFAVRPITTFDSAGGTYIIGALIAGDVANGINLIPEKGNDILDKEGYSALYIVPNLDIDNGDVLRFQLISSALRQDKTTIEVDLEVDGVQSMLMEIYNNPSGLSSKTLSIHGTPHFATARCSPRDYTFKTEGRLFVKSKTGSKCNIIVIQTAEASLTSAYEHELHMRTSFC